MKELKAGFHLTLAGCFSQGVRVSLQAGWGFRKRVTAVFAFRKPSRFQRAARLCLRALSHGGRHCLLPLTPGDISSPSVNKVKDGFQFTTRNKTTWEESAWGLGAGTQSTLFHFFSYVNRGEKHPDCESPLHGMDKVFRLPIAFGRHSHLVFPSKIFINQVSWGSSVNCHLDEPFHCWAFFANFTPLSTCICDLISYYRLLGL